MEETEEKQIESHIQFVRDRNRAEYTNAILAMWGDYRRWKQFDTNEGRWGDNFWRINKNLDRLIETLGPVICFVPYRSKLYKCGEEQA